MGLGKTYTALAVVKYCEQRNERVLVLYQASNGHIEYQPFTSLDSYAWPSLPIYNAIALHNSHGTNLLARQRRTI